MTLDYGVAPPGYRLPDATRLGAVRLQVADLERSLDYYQRVLGLRLLDHEAGQAALGAEGEEQPLVVLHERPGVRPVPRSGLLGLYHFAILLPDRQALGRFVAHLGTLGEHAGSADHAVSEALYLTDPDGLGIEVYADRPRSQWQHHNRELYMTTDRLDIRSLLAAAGERSWTGMPSGTTMGHVHLHVGDLERAEGVLSPRARLRQGGVVLPGCAVLVRRRLSPSPGKQHLVVRPARVARRCTAAAVGDPPASRGGYRGRRSQPASGGARGAGV